MRADRNSLTLFNYHRNCLNVIKNFPSRACLSLFLGNTFRWTVLVADPDYFYSSTLFYHFGFLDCSSPCTCTSLLLANFA
jgi:hypothetical protein